MERRLSTAQLVGLIAIALIFGGVALIFGNVKNKEKEEIVYLTYKDDEKANMVLNGDYLEYIPLGSAYEEQGIIATSKSGKNILDDVSITYYKDDREVANIDTSKLGTYQVKYSINDNGTKTISRVVSIADRKSPSISIPENQTITSAEAASFDLNNGVVASDNSGNVKLTFENTLSTLAGDYIITYTAVDESLNKTVRKRLIKVVSGIDFEYKDNKLTIKYPPSSKEHAYIYKYSLDSGSTWVEAKARTIVEFTEGSVLAAVYENNNYVMANSYSTKK